MFVTDNVALVRQDSQQIETWTPRLAVNIEQAIAAVEAKQTFYQRVMRPDVHYGVIPGTKGKPTLLKSGAELLLSSFGLCAELTNASPPIIDMTGIDHLGEPFIHYHRRCEVYRTTADGQRVKVAQAEGSCNSWESKYRYRDSKRVCPECNQEAIIKGKAEYGGGWLCFRKNGCCGAKFQESDPAIMEQVIGRIPNPDVADLDNTILKIADKRSYVATVLLATGCSDIFTQDLEDMPRHMIGGGARDSRPEAESVEAEYTVQDAQPQQNRVAPELLRQRKEANEALGAILDSRYPGVFGGARKSIVNQALGLPADIAAQLSNEQIIAATKAIAMHPIPAHSEPSRDDEDEEQATRARQSARDERDDDAIQRVPHDPAAATEGQRSAQAAHPDDNIIPKPTQSEMDIAASAFIAAARAHKFDVMTDGKPDKEKVLYLLGRCHKAKNNATMNPYGGGNPTIHSWRKGPELLAAVAEADRAARVDADLTDDDGNPISDPFEED